MALEERDDLRSFLEASPEDVAPHLLGCFLTSDVRGHRVVLQIGEAEAYKGSEDSASHAFKGRTHRNGSMFEPAGTLYVYKSYGIHWCANVACGPIGTGWGVLLRGGKIVQGEGTARARRGENRALAEGPGMLCEALGIDGTHDGLDLLGADSEIRLSRGERPAFVMATPRVGISKATDLPWRFVAASSASSID